MTWNPDDHDRAPAGTFTEHRPTDHELGNLAPDDDGQRFTDVNSRSFTAARAAQVEKDLDTVQPSGELLRDVIAAGLTGKHSSAVRGKVGHYLTVQEPNEDAPRTYSVSEATWSAVDAPDDRGVEGHMGDAIQALEFRYTALAGRESSTATAAKLSALRRRISSISNRRNMIIAFGAAGR
jgi:hypothetical protein